MKGTGVSPGISTGRAYILRRQDAVPSGILVTTEEAKRAEIEKFRQAVQSSVGEISTILESERLAGKSVESDILETQIEFLTDPQIESDVIDKIRKEDKTAHDAVIEAIYSAALMLSNMDDDYLKARAADVRDTGTMILNFIDHGKRDIIEQFNEETIIVAEDLSPAETVMLDSDLVVGFVTVSGGVTSHASIIARAKGIPAVAGCGTDLMNISQNEILILDGSSGDVIINPDQKTIDAYRIKQEKVLEEIAFLKTLKDIPSITADGHPINLFGNISGHNDIDDVFHYGGQGVGLLRTEILFMGRKSMPSEEEQFQYYKQVALKSKGRPVTIRTLDIGGDKQLPYFGIPEENNPALGYRAIRICLNQTEIFISQLKAILRAGLYGNFKIMFPMISGVKEILDAKICVQEAKDQLVTSGYDFRNDIELGIMIEIPGAAITADILAREVDFFSIGTNDLCQYTLAVDRMNDKVSYLYDHFNPGLLRLIKYVIEQANMQKIRVSLCGEMASDPLATLLLIGMGLGEFSMGAASIPRIKNVIVNNHLSAARKICTKVMEMDNSISITRYLKEFSK